MNKRLMLIGVAVLLPVLGLAAALAGLHGLALAQGPVLQAMPGYGFTYQGQLIPDGDPVSGTCAMAFRLYDDFAGAQVGTSITQTVAVTGGLFTVKLDFGGGAFDGQARWLDIRVACPAGSGSWADLGRQALAPAPYALALPGLWTQQNATSPNLIGGYSGNSAGPGVGGAAIGGGGSSSGPNLVTGSFGVVDGGWNNQVGVQYAAIGGGANNRAGGQYAVVGGGYGNQAISTSATVGGGYVVTASGQGAAVGGGYYNRASGAYAAVGGGYGNQAISTSATVGGGYGVTATGRYATVGGGYYNRAGNGWDTVGGGSGNVAWGVYSIVGGGRDNEASGMYAAIGGGYGNKAGGDYATAPGGVYNLASGDRSFAAGYRAHANQNGCFTWGDSTEGDYLDCDVPDAFLARASGGVTFYTNSGLTSGSYLAPGGSAWINVSARERKENFAPVDGAQLLDRLGEIDITTWNYKSQPPSIRHVGPMADDFNGLVAGLGGEGQGAINSLDADGVALAAIQALYARNRALAAENAALRARLDSQEARLAALEAAIEGGGR